MARDDRPKPLTWRAVIIGLVGSALVTVWIHHAELVMGGMRGHTALANTSIPVGGFGALVGIVVVNLAIRAVLPNLALSQGELITAYVMMTVSTVLASSGGIHFLVPTLAAAFHYATPENQWAQFHQWIPTWFAPRDTAALDAFYVGGAPVPVKVWLTPFLVWGGFLVAFTTATLCITAILRRPWVDHERLTFPTAVLPLELTESRGRLLKNKLMWGGFAIAFGIGTVNNLHLNIPTVPGIQVRPINAARWFPSFPWNAIGDTPISFYPFMVGIAYLLSLEVSFSYWFFFLLTKAQVIFCAAQGWRPPEASLASGPPYLQNQGAGAFIALALVSLWMSRRYLREVVRRALGLRGPVGAEEREPLPYRWAVFGLVASAAALVGMCWAAGMNPLIAGIVFALVFLYLIAATRIRAEAGNAWLFGPEVDPNMLVTETLGVGVLRPVDLTVMAYLRSVTTFDMRCASMPHQLDGFRMATAAGISLRQLVWAMIVAIVLAIAVAFWSGLVVWYTLGAEAKTDAWRTIMGQQPFVKLQSQLTSTQRPHFMATMFDGVGAGVTCLLAFARARLPWFPLHPVGYAMANTFPWGLQPMPFFIAWLVKGAVLRFGGMRLYRRSLPFFLGLILGDLTNGAFYTLLGAFVDMSVYPVNW
ncbi:MAG: hypothetical protein JSV65_13465 [Armatimonadota bacterium]|nr:MAG: hypothetical protein JSV65_13465 [Armatimonadota bacterium]